MKTAIVDYELCNMFSVKHACESVGMSAVITSSAKEMTGADLVILPGVGAFADAMNALRRLDLIEPVKDIVASGKPLVGVCLGMQLLMEHSEEFGNHRGLGILPGSVKKFRNKPDRLRQKSFKIPHMGWSRVDRVQHAGSAAWPATPLDGIPANSYFYFVHSYYVEPVQTETILATTSYGEQAFCSAIQWKNLYAFQFHPERSGIYGIQIYQNLKSLVTQNETLTPEKAGR